MSDRDLRDLLVELADTVDTSTVSLAPPAWRAAQIVRRRRRRLVGFCAAACVAAVVSGTAVIAARDRDTNPTPAGPTPSVATPSLATGPVEPTPGSRPRFQQAPDPVAVADLPATGAWFTVLGSRPPDPVPSLEDDPAHRIVAAVQTGSSTPLILGDDGRWRQVPLPTDSVRSGDGNLGPALTASAISPDSTQIAFPQPDAVLIVDAATGAQHRHAVPGPNTDVSWLPDGRLVVDRGRGFALLDPATGSLTRANGPHDRLATGDPHIPLAELSSTDLTLRNADGKVTARRGLSAKLLDCACDLYGPPSTRAGRITRNGFLSQQYNDDNAVLVVDLASGQVSDVLRLSDRANDCCTTLGWLDDDTVLVRDGQHVLAWNTANHTLQRLADLPPRAPTGEAMPLALSPILSQLRPT
jgi:hypothetical protein